MAQLVTKRNVAQKDTVVLLQELNDYVVNYIENGANKIDCEKILVVYRNQNIGTLYWIPSYFHIPYLGTTLTDQNSIREGIKNSLKSGNACYHSVRDLLSSSCLSKNIKTDTQNCNFACCFVWVRNLIAHIEGGT